MIRSQWNEWKKSSPVLNARQSIANWRTLLTVLVVIPAVCGLPQAESQVAAQDEFDEPVWRFTLRKPRMGWERPDFDDGRWAEGYGGFGTPGTPGARVGTTWETSDIWMRKRFELKTVPQQAALLIHHDEDAEVYINGEQVAALQGFLVDYKVVPLSDKARGLLKVGENVLAAHCHQERGGQFIDVHVVDAANVPSLPAPKRKTTPFESELITQWGARVTPENAWQEYPRPGLAREDWVNLNGHWDYAIQPREQEDAPNEWDGQILVPFCLESRLSGVRRLLDPGESLWYRRSFETTASDDRRVKLNFEAVDYQCTVSVNGKIVGRHTGGNIPFSFDITDAVNSGKNELVVRVVDETEGSQLRGKQTLTPRGIWYTQVSGIWQTVWLEHVAPRHIVDLRIETDPEDGTITVDPEIHGTTGDGGRVRVEVRDGQELVANAEGGAEPLRIEIDEPKLWSPASPHLYDLTISLLDADGTVVDQVTSYAGIRSVGKKRDSDGHLRFTLNGEILFHFGPLDQGWWPDGLLTPPSDEGMLYDIEFLKDAGFNMIRKHIKVEPRRYYYHCDRLGMLVWQDQVSGGQNPPWTRLQPEPDDAEWSDGDHKQFMYEFAEMVDSLENHPSIVVWTPFNEAWGQHRTIEVGEWIAERDPTRLVNIASGGNFWPVGDIVDAHRYPHPGFPFDAERFQDYIHVMGEFGGHGWPVQGHLWDNSRRNWGYGGLPQTIEEYENRYIESIRLLAALKEQGVAAGVYTQTTDVEGEINGLITYDRKRIKLPASRLRQIHQVLFEDSSPEATSAVPAGITPRTVDDPATITAGLQSHDKALYIKSGWIRDPYIVPGPDGNYYLTGTTPLPDDPRQHSDPYNTGLWQTSIVGWKMQVWRSPDLIHWERLGTPFTLKDGVWYEAKPERFAEVDERQWRLWAPELHWHDGSWIIVHTSPSPVRGANLALTSGAKLEGPYQHPMGTRIGRRHDPSLFQDDNGTWWLIWGATQIAPLKPDFSDLAGSPTTIGPSGGTSRMGHEGCLIRKIGKTYVLFGTGWSTGEMRKGSYNLYYATADRITGPYSERRFAGRFLGHGTPFRDLQGQWWCTAFYNANVPPLSPRSARGSDLSQTAQTINEQGVTIVPLDVHVDSDGRVQIRATDPDYASPGPDELQVFDS